MSVALILWHTEVSASSMAKFKPSRGAKKTGATSASWRGGAPCLIVLGLGLVLFIVIVYYAFQGG
jgi:hypothetical protein